MKDEDFREFYFHEWHRRDQVTTYTNIPLTLATALVGGLFFLLQNHPHPLDGDPATCLFWLLFSLAGLCLAVGMYFLARTIYGYEYSRIPSLQALRKFRADRLEWQSKPENLEDDQSPEEATEEYFKDYWQRKLSKAQDQNAKSNRKKLEYLDTAMKFILPAVALTALTAVPYFFSVLSPTAGASGAVSEIHEEGGGSMEYPEIEINGGTGNTPSQPPPEPDVEDTRDARVFLELGGTGGPPPEPDNEPLPTENSPPAEPDNDFTKNEKTPIERG